MELSKWQHALNLRMMLMLEILSKATGTLHNIIQLLFFFIHPVGISL